MPGGLSPPSSEGAEMPLAPVPGLSETTTALCVLLIFLVPLAAAGLSLINAGWALPAFFGRSGDAARARSGAFRNNHGALCSVDFPGSPCRRGAFADQCRVGSPRLLRKERRCRSRPFRGFPKQPRRFVFC